MRSYLAFFFFLKNVNYMPKEVYEVEKNMWSFQNQK